MSQVVTPLLAANTKMAWKPLYAVGVASDPTAPFVLGTTVHTDGEFEFAKFARVAAGGLVIDASAGITAGGVTTTAAAGNTWVNKTGVALLEGDYAFLVANESAAAHT